VRNAALPLTLFLAAAALTACGGGTPDAQPGAATAASAARPPDQGTPPPSATSAPAEPRTAAAAKALAQEEADRYSSGDYEGAWDLWAAADKQVISGAEYARFHETCTTSGVPLKVESVRLTSTGAVARLDALSFKFSYRLAYEDGHWRWHINDDDLTDYRKGVDAMIKQRKAKGQCDPK
jgi:hypothetical protein